MKTIRNTYFLFLSLLFLNAAYLNAQEKVSFQEDMSSWKQRRIEALKAPTGWLNLTGLFWLKPGKNSFGSDPSNQFVYKHKDMPKFAGYFLYENKKVRWVSASKVVIRIKDSIISDQIIYEEGKTESPVLSIGNLRWNVIQRDDKIGIRLRDVESLLVKNFKGCERFKDDSSFRILAKVETKPDNKLLITNVLGQTNAQESPGKLIFQIGGKTYQLDALREGKELFILFGDATSGKETYPAGRFLYADLPDENGYTILDFNKAYNPPCAFTIYATCPLPPKQNILPIPIRAGEKDHLGGRR